ncbi:MAG: hypothetical protein QM621_13985 [Aeromicrobium sp.]|uniref:hypothetical protein n=1 Tax=Aeromicrobium sp. TaxID=1871063 RepID=UPI0039E37D9A
MITVGLETLVNVVVLLCALGGFYGFVRRDLHALRDELKGDIAQLRADLTETRGELKGDIVRLEAKIDHVAQEAKADLAAARMEWKEGLAETRTEWKEGLAEARTEWRDELSEARTEWKEGLGEARTEWKEGLGESRTQWREALVEARAEWREQGRLLMRKIDALEADMVALQQRTGEEVRRAREELAARIERFHLEELAHFRLLSQQIFELANGNRPTPHPTWQRAGGIELGPAANG